ncbi:MAG: large repetitive protein [Actinomycetota bacterium]|nr:large repetitive protein [Actinomycetota bacterium]
MRRGEVLGLRCRDLDLERGRLSIRQTITLVDHKIVIANRTKTGKGRAVDLDSTTIAELRAHRAANGSPITSYVVTPFLAGTAQAARVFNSTATAETVTGLTNAASYTFGVAARNGRGTGPAAASGSVAVGTPTAPHAPMAEEWPYVCEECGRESSIVDEIRRANSQGTLDLGSAASR